MSVNLTGPLKKNESKSYHKYARTTQDLVPNQRNKNVLSQTFWHKYLEYFPFKIYKVKNEYERQGQEKMYGGKFGIIFGFQHKIILNIQSVAKCTHSTNNSIYNKKNMQNRKYFLDCFAVLKWNFSNNWYPSVPLLLHAAAIAFSESKDDFSL